MTTARKKSAPALLLEQMAGTTNNATDQAKTKRIAFAKYPRILRRNVVTAINRLERMAKFLGIEDDVTELLRKYRTGQLSHPLHPPIHVELMPFAEKLDEAFAAIHTYQPEDYFSEGTFSVAQRHNRRRAGKRSPKFDQDHMGQILDDLVAAKGLQAIEQASVSAIVIWSQARWKLGETPSESTFRRAIEKKFGK